MYILYSITVEIVLRYTLYITRHVHQRISAKALVVKEEPASLA